MRKEVKKNKVLQVRVTPEEAKSIFEKIEGSSFETPSQLIRYLLKIWLKGEQK